MPTPCRFGVRCKNDGCTFAHPLREVAQDPGTGPDDRVCVWFQKGKCRNGAVCKFQHVQQERDTNIIVVRDLPKSVAPDELERELIHHFKACGYLARIQVKTDLSGRCRGFAFVVFCDASSADKALQCSHPSWDIKRKTDLPIYVEGDTRDDRKTRSAVQCVDAPLRLPFNSRDRVLLVGEGDFSFSAAAIKMGCLEPSLALATSNEPPRSMLHLEGLIGSGAQIRTDVDATDLSSASLAEAVDVVVFNFPHTGEPSIEANQRLLQGFFKSARDVLRPGGRIAVTLKQTWPYSEWDISACSEAGGFQELDAYPFPARALHDCGYTHSTTDDIPHQVGFLQSARTFEFGVA